MRNSGRNELIQPAYKLTETAALQMVQAAVNKAEALGIRATIAIVDSSGALLAFLKMTDSFLVSSELARKKAYSAVGMGAETANLEQELASSPSRVLDGLTKTQDFTVIGGGVPLYWDQTLIGGIGVSGGSEGQDVECARAGAASFATAESSS
jgi:uncharacterized protein GlcG (DUF336 family)